MDMFIPMLILILWISISKILIMTNGEFLLGIRHLLYGKGMISI